LRVVVIGANGQLGSDLCRHISKSDLVPLTHKDIEITDIDSVKQVLKDIKPSVIINTAAFVRVDDCEDNRDICYLVNTLGAKNVAVVTQGLKAKYVFISTDYVFGGDIDRKAPYTEFDYPSPINTLGHSKLAAENIIQHVCNGFFIVRISGIFGIAGSSGKGGNFIETIINLAKSKPELRVVNDQVFSPTYTKDAAKKISDLIKTENYGIFHITNKGACSWYEFTTEILKLAGLKTPVIPITSAEYPQKARRPSYSVLDNYHLRLLGMDDMRPWQEALKDYLVAKGHIA
jgi:dTDP-4-dehydrorhamnose reductase